jgi:hypothetical protein
MKLGQQKSVDRLVRIGIGGKGLVRENLGARWVMVKKINP